MGTYKARNSAAYIACHESNFAAGSYCLIVIILRESDKNWLMFSARDS